MYTYTIIYYHMLWLLTIILTVLYRTSSKSSKSVQNKLTFSQAMYKHKLITYPRPQVIATEAKVMALTHNVKKGYVSLT